MKQRGRLIVQSQMKHSYPFCWRSDTPLIYRAIPAWFVRVQPVVDKILGCNEKMRWYDDNDLLGGGTNSMVLTYLD